MITAKVAGAVRKTGREGTGASTVQLDPLMFVRAPPSLKQLGGIWGDAPVVQVVFRPPGGPPAPRPVGTTGKRAEAGRGKRYLNGSDADDEQNNKWEKGVMAIKGEKQIEAFTGISAARVEH